MLGTSKSIWGFTPLSIPGAVLWLDGGDNNSMNSTSAVTVWNDKSGNSNTMTGSGTWSGGTMVFNGTTNAFSNLTFVFPSSNYSMFAVYSNTTAPASLAYMNVVYGSNGYPMLGVYDVNKYVSALSVVANTGALSGTVSVGWAAQIASANDDVGNGIATDTSGNVLVTGYYNGALTLYNQGGTAGTTLPFTGGFDCFIAKYSSAGAVVWAAQIAGTTTSTDIGYGIATDPSGNVLVTGYYQAALTLYNQGPSGTAGTTLPFTGGNDCFVAKYSSAGAVVWAARIASTGAVNDNGYAIATDSSGNVLVTGDYRAALTLYNQGPSGTAGTTLPFTGGNDCFIAKYSSAGAVVWAAQIAGTTTSGDRGNGIATDSSGNVLVAGDYSAALTLYNQGPSGTAGTTLPYVGGGDCFVAKYSSAGAVVWAARIAGTTTSVDSGQAIATDSSGNVLVTGLYQVALTVYNQGPSGTAGTTLPVTGGTDVFIAKYSSAGAVVWAARIAGTTTSGDQGRAIATDSSGNVLVTGYYSAALTLYNQGPSGTAGTTLPFTGLQGCFVAKYSSAGAVVWAARIVGAAMSSDIGYGIATDSSGNVLVTGQYQNTVTFYNQGPSGTAGTTLPWTGGNDCFVVKYNPDGYITIPAPANSNVLVDVTYTPSTMSPFVNGFTATTLAGTTLATTGIYVGGPSNYFNGTISEVLIYNSTLTAAQRQTVEGYLAYKWRIQSNLPTIQPFYTITPFSRTFGPTDILGCSLWLDGADNSTMNSTTAVTVWNDKSGNSNTMTGTGTWTGSNMTFNGSTNAFSNLTYVFPNSNYSIFGVYSNTTGPTDSNYQNVLYGSNGYPRIGTLGASNATWSVIESSANSNGWTHVSSDSTGSNLFACDGTMNFWTGRFNGSTWSWQIQSGFSDIHVASAPSSNGSNVAIASTYSVYTGIYNGSTWAWTQHMGSGTGIPAGVSVFQQVACDYSGSNVVVAASPGYVYTGIYNGSTWAWTQQTPPGSNANYPGFSMVASDSTGSNIAVAKGTSGYIWTGRRISGGSYTWTGASAAGSNNWISVTLSANGSNIIAGINISVLWRGTYNGTSWTWAAITGSPSGGVWITTVLSSNGSNLTLLNKAGYVWLAVYNGTTWTFNTQTSLGRINGAISAIASDPTGSVLTASTSNTLASSGFPSYIIRASNALVSSYSPYVFAAQFLNAYASANIPPRPATSTVLVSAVTSSTAFRSFVNGLENVSTTASATLATTGIYVGGPSNYFNGSISELLVYSSTLSTAQRQQVEGYLAAKWGLRASLSSNQPYKTLLPATLAPAQYANVTPGNWTQDWQPYLKSLAAANATGVTVTTSNLTGGATFATSGWWGAVVGSDGNIYFCPMQAANFLKLTVSTGVTTNITGGGTYTGGGWRGGVLGPDGNIYCVPNVATNILKLTVSTGVTTNITGGAVFTASGWYGGALGPDGNIYFGPTSATNILKLNVATGVTTNITGGATYTANGWRGAVLGSDGNIYFTPYAATNILKLNVATGVTTNITGAATYTANGWYGGGVVGTDGNIYFPPYAATNILKLNVATGVTTNITGAAAYTSFGWYGGALGPDGNIYFTPSSASNVLKLDVSTEVTTNITGTATYNSLGGWFGGVLAPDGNIYCAPYGSSNVFTIAFSGLSQKPSSNYTMSAYANRS